MLPRVAKATNQEKRGRGLRFTLDSPSGGCSIPESPLKAACTLVVPAPKGATGAALEEMYTDCRHRVSVEALMASYAGGRLFAESANLRVDQGSRATPYGAD